MLPLLLLAACTSEPESLVFPEPSALPALEEPPDALTTWQTGEAITTAEAWTDLRAPEIDALFAHYIYGDVPQGTATDVTVVDEVTVRTGPLVQYLASHERGEVLLALWLPPTPGRHPVILGLNKCGNPTVFDDDAVIDHGGYTDPTCSTAPGSRSSYWNIEQTVAQGYAVATLHQSDTAPDDRDALHPSPAVASWASALRLGVDILTGLDTIDPDAIAVMGHSRRGKAALLAAAHDPRIAAVWAHQSGTLGASLTRSFEGESIEAITTFFPHWFDPRAAEFASDPTTMPVDQHLLLARIAPRPVLLIDGDDDSWADPDGARQSAELAVPVFDLLDGPAPTWMSRPGGHEVTAEDWEAAVGWLSEL